MQLYEKFETGQVLTPAPELVTHPAHHSQVDQALEYMLA